MHIQNAKLQPTNSSGFPSDVSFHGAHTVPMVGPVGFEPTTSAESLVYGYLHALPNFLIPPYWSVFPIVMDSGARLYAELTTFKERSPGSVSSLARLRPLSGPAMSSCPVPHQFRKGNSRY